MHRTAAFIAFIACVAAAVDVHAAPCAGFTDVDEASSFCPNVQWVMNRSVTLGCTSPTLFCPGDGVTRLQMAVFMHRLGTALTPVHIRSEQSFAPLDLDPGFVICQTNDYDVQRFPRRAAIDAVLTATAASEIDLGVEVVKSLDFGASWEPLNAAPSRGFVPASRWGALSDLGEVDLAVGDTVRFGVRVSRAGLPGGADLADSRCQVRVTLQSRDGAAPPF